MSLFFFFNVLINIEYFKIVVSKTEPGLSRWTTYELMQQQASILHVVYI